MNKLNKYMLFWLSQSVSQLGSAMTSFALIIWAFEKSGSAMDVSLMTFFSYVPYILVSFFAGPLVDRYRKKTIILVSDCAAAMCSGTVLILLAAGKLEPGYIYGVNAVIGLMNAFQSPAQSAAVGLMVPDGEYARVSGMNSLSNNLITMGAPVLAAALQGIGGLKLVVLADLCSFLIAQAVLMFFISIPETGGRKEEGRPHPFEAWKKDLKEGLEFLKIHRELGWLMMGMATLNFFSMMTYENILSPMILARSGGNKAVLGLVNAVLGAGGIAGGLLVTGAGKMKKPVNMIFLSAAVSFLLGDLLMGIGRSGPVWCLAAVAASLPIPICMAGQNLCYYRTVPKEMQGRIFSLKNVLQYVTIPMGLLAGGWLADYVLEPFMASVHPAAGFLQTIVGTGRGSGMALLFLCTGMLGCMFSAFWYKKLSKMGMLHKKQ